MCRRRVTPITPEIILFKAKSHLIRIRLDFGISSYFSFQLAIIIPIRRGQRLARNRDDASTQKQTNYDGNTFWPNERWRWLFTFSETHAHHSRRRTIIIIIIIWVCIVCIRRQSCDWDSVCDYCDWCTVCVVFRLFLFFSVFVTRLMVILCAHNLCWIDWAFFVVCRPKQQQRRQRQRRQHQQRQ